MIELFGLTRQFWMAFYSGLRSLLLFATLLTFVARIVDPITYLFGLLSETAQHHLLQTDGCNFIFPTFIRTREQHFNIGVWIHILYLPDAAQLQYSLDFQF